MSEKKGRSIWFIAIVFSSAWLILCAALYVFALEKRIAALEQARVPVFSAEPTFTPPSTCSIGDTFEDDGKLYECVAKDTWRLKERK